MDNQIICPNCGAPNESTSTSCQFCGASLVATKTKKKKTKKSEPSSEVSVSEIKGKPQIKFDERIFHLNYNELSGSAKLIINKSCDSCFRSYAGCIYSFDCKELHIYNVKAIISDGKRYDFHGDINIGTDNLNLLETFCNLDWKNCKIVGVEEGEEMLFVLVCQAFYNTIFDHSKYTDATDKLYEYYLQCIAQEKLKEEKFEKKMRRRNCRDWAIVILLCLMIMAAFWLFALFV